MGVLGIVPFLIVANLSSAPAPNEAPTVRVEAANDGVTAHMEGVIDAPLELVAAVVGDVERYPCWLPIFGGVRSARTFALQPLYDTEWRLPWPLGVLHQRMRFERMPVDHGVSFFFEQRDGDMQRHEGYWILTSRGRHTHVIYEAKVAFRTWVPQFLIATFQQTELPKLLQKLRDETRRRAASNVATISSAACNQPS